MHSEGAPKLENNLVKKYFERLELAQRVYEAFVQERIEEDAGKPREGWLYYNSSLEGDDPITLKPSGYFNPNHPQSFYGIGDYDADTFTDEIRDFQEDPGNAGRSVMIFDPFGQGTAFRGIADEIVCTTLHENYKKMQDVTEFNGDALSAQVSDKVFSHIAARVEKGTALRATFFRPYGGIEHISHNLYVHHRLYQNLCRIYELTDDGGLVFIQTSGSGHDVDFLREVLEDFHLGSLASPKKNGNLGLVIRKNKAVCARLPSMRQILAKNPRLVERLLNVDTTEYDQKFWPPEDREKQPGG